MRRMEIPKYMADTIYSKKTDEFNALSSILIKLPDNMSEEELIKYYSDAIKKYLSAGLASEMYIQKMADELNIKGRFQMEGYYAFIEDGQWNQQINNNIDIMLNLLDNMIVRKYEFSSPEDARAFYTTAYGVCAELWIQKATLELKEKEGK